jgi:uncharacterized protein
MLHAAEYHEFKFGDVRIILKVNTLEVFFLDELSVKLLNYIRDKSFGNIDSFFKRFGKNRSQRIIKLLEDSSLIIDHIDKQEIKPVVNSVIYNIKTIDLFISQQCNLTCIYCYDRKNKKIYGNEFKLMDRVIAERSIDFLLNNSNGYNNLYVCFFGGEPLLNMKILKHTVLYAEKLGVKFKKEFFFSITTNGTLLNDEAIKFFIKHKIKILISLDGDFKTQNANRPFINGRGSYSQIVENLTEISKSNLNYSSRATVTSRDIKNISTNFKHHLSLGFNKIHFENALGEDANFLINSKVDIDAIKKQYYLVAKTIISNYKSGGNYSFAPITQPISTIINGLKMNYSCIIGRSYVAVDVNGDIYLCHRLVGNRTFQLGNVMNKLYDTKWIDFINTKLEVDNREKCSKCWAKYLCGGGCLALNYENNHDIGIPLESYCELKRYAIEMALFIYYSINKCK